MARVASRGVAGTEEGGGRKKGVCLLTLRYYVLFFSLRLYNVVKMHNNNKRKWGRGEEKEQREQAESCQSTQRKN